MFCPRCDAVTVWDTPGDGTLQCTNWRDLEPEHCGFTHADPLTDEEWRAFDRYHRLADAREPQANHREEPALVVRRTPYVWT
jgi:hypothetical protein